MDEILKGWRDAFKKASDKASDLARNLAFAGIGIIWIFNKPVADKEVMRVDLPEQLMLPLILIVLALMADVLQYLWKSATIYQHYRNQRKKYMNNKLTEEEMSTAELPRHIAWSSWGFFGAKIVLICYAYFLILSFLVLSK